MSDPDTRESITSIEAINAAGEAAPSMLILPGVTLLEHEFDNDINDNVLFATNKESGSGYSNDQLALDWLEMFEKATQPGIKTRHGTIHNKEWRMLIMDGHGSHLTMEFMDYCWNIQIVPFKLIAHSTHPFQPCDVGFFHLMKQHHQNILAEQVRYGDGADYTRSDFLDAFNEVYTRTKKKSTILHTWEKAGLWPYQPRIVLEKMQRIEAPQRLLNPERWTTPEPEIPSLDINWVEAPTPDTSMVAIRPYSDYIDHCLSSAINGTIPISPTVRRVIDKRNKAQNIMTLEGVLSLEELEKKRLEEIRRLQHKQDGGSRRVQTNHGVISKGDAKLRIAGRAAFLVQEKQLRQQNIIDKINKLGEYRWGVTA